MKESKQYTIAVIPNVKELLYCWLKLLIRHHEQ